MKIEPELLFILSSQRILFLPEFVAASLKTLESPRNRESQNK